MAYTSSHTGITIDGWNGRIATLESSMTTANSSITSLGSRTTTLEGKTGYLPANNTGTVGQYLKKTGASAATWAEASAALFFTNKQVATSAWTADSTYASYPYKANISCSGITSNDYAEVVFDLNEAITGFYCPLCTTGSDIVSIYAINIPSNTITIPTIMCIKAPQ